MQRDLELIRHIFLTTEALSNPEEPVIHTLAVEGFAQPVVNEHVKILIDSGYLEGEYKYATNNRIFLTLVRSLTPRGFDFLDNIRHERVWSALKNRVQQTTETAAIGIVEELAAQMVQAMLGRPQ